MKIIGLLNLKELFVFNDFSINFENAVNASYKMSEDGAFGIVIWGNTFNTRLKIYQYLKTKLDIPVAPFVLTEKQRAKILDEKTVFADKKLPGTIFTTVPDNLAFLKNRLSESILIPNKHLEKIFKTSPDFIEEYSALIAFRLNKLGYDFLITEEVLSAQKGTELYKRLF